MTSQPAELVRIAAAVLAAAVLVDVVMPALLGWALVVLLKPVDWWLPRRSGARCACPKRPLRIRPFPGRRA